MQYTARLAIKVGTRDSGTRMRTLVRSLSQKLPSPALSARLQAAGKERESLGNMVEVVNAKIVPAPIGPVVEARQAHRKDLS